MKKMSLLTSIFCLWICSSQSQTGLELNLNAYRPGDNIVKQQIEYAAPGEGGRNIVWDFSQLGVINEHYPLIYFSSEKDDSTRIGSWEHQTRYHFEQKDGNLWMTGYRNSSVQMNFDLPELQMRFPFFYGDTVSMPFRGEGMYYYSTEIKAEGRTHIQADATGTLITPGCDTLKNVLRIKRIREYSDISVDSATIRLETYNWYARGYRYPVMESNRSFSIINEQESKNFDTSFYFPLVAIESLEADTENEQWREKNQTDQGILLQCVVYPNPVETTATLSFELKTKATVLIRICNLVGHPISIVRQGLLDEGLHEINLPVNDLPTGNYLLYVQANNYVKRQILIKK